MSLSFALRHLRQSGVVGRCAFAVAAAACLGLLFPAQGFATSSKAQTQRVQATGEAQAFDIPAGPLAASLNALSRAAGLTLAVDPTEVAGKTAPAVAGAFTPQQALERLLAGSGLRHRFTGDTTVTLERSFAEAADGPLRLAPISVEGLVAEEGRAGLFGDRRIEDIPFSITGYTERTIEAQQARTLPGVLDNDPAVRSINPRNNAVDTYTIRGFVLENSDVATDGLVGMSPTRSTNLAPFERVEVFRGPNALLNGVPATGNIGGVINLVPKRATNDPISELNLTYESDGHVGTHVDIGRRFGPEMAFGVRFNGVYRDGNLSADGTSLKTPLASLALDYNQDWLRASADLLYQESRFDAQQRPFVVASNDFDLPDAPSNSTNAAQSFAFRDNETLRGVIGLEVDPLDDWTVGVRYGRLRETEEFQWAAADIILNTAGETDGNPSSRSFTIDVGSLEGSIKGLFDTGAISHEFAIQATRLTRELDLASGAVPLGVDLTGGTVSNPIRISRPNFPDLPSEELLFDQTFSSVAVSDIVSFIDDRIQITGGLRLQRLEQQFFDLETGDETFGFEQTELSPTAGIVVKPIETLSLYASYSEGLTPGPQAPSTAENAFEFVDPAVSKQIEVGAKYDSNGFGASVALFRITQPQGLLDPDTNRFSSNGEIRNRGIEALVYGDLTEGFRLLGGLLVQDGEQTETAGGAFDGNDAVGIPTIQFNLYSEYDVPFVQGLSLNGRVIYTSKQFVDTANQQSIPGWERFDLGASYDVELGDTFATLNVDVLNVAGNDYWASAARGQISQGVPRTFLLTTGFRF